MPRELWTEDELLLAMNLYYRISFGRQDEHDKEVIQLAKAIGRTPASVAMRLSNFTAVDPDEKDRVKGLAGGGSKVANFWTAFHHDYEAMAARSQELWDEVVLAGNASLQPGAALPPDAVRATPMAAQDSAAPPAHLTPPDPIFTGSAMEALIPRKVRLAQTFFRRTVLAAYNNRCCITGLDVPELLRASHIVPWASAPEHRVNPHNGLCLSAIHDAAFDKYLISFTPDELRLTISPRLKDATTNDLLQREFAAYEGKPLQLPERFVPDRKLLQAHFAQAQRQ